MRCLLARTYIRTFLFELMTAHVRSLQKNESSKPGPHGNDIPGWTFLPDENLDAYVSVRLLNRVFVLLTLVSKPFRPSRALANRVILSPIQEADHHSFIAGNSIMPSYQFDRTIGITSTPAGKQ